MSDHYPITETIIDTDGLNGEAFARLYREWVECETIFGTVPVEVDDADGTLTVTIHDPTDMAPGNGDDDVRHFRGVDPDDVFGAPDLSRFGGNGGDDE